MATGIDSVPWAWVPVLHPRGCCESGFSHLPHPYQAFPTLRGTAAPSSREDLTCPISLLLPQGCELCSHQKACIQDPLPGPALHSLRRAPPRSVFEGGLQGKAMRFSFLLASSSELLGNAAFTLLPPPPWADIWQRSLRTEGQCRGWPVVDRYLPKSLFKALTFLVMQLLPDLSKE